MTVNADVNPAIATYSGETKVWHVFRVFSTFYLLQREKHTQSSTFTVPSKMKERKVNHEFSPHSSHSRTRISVGYELGLTPHALFAKENVSPKTLDNLVRRYHVSKSGTSKPR